MKRVLILMSNTGGGHKASADAIRAGFAQLYGDKYKVCSLNFCLSSCLQASLFISLDVARVIHVLTDDMYLVKQDIGYAA